MQDKSDSPLIKLSAAPVPPPEIYPSEQHQEQRGQNNDRYTENIFQSNTSKVNKDSNRFKPMRNASFHSAASFIEQKNLDSQSSIKDFTSRQDSKIIQGNVYEPLLDPELQNDNNSDTDTDVESIEDDQRQNKRDSVQVVDNKSSIFQGEEIQPAIQPIGKNTIQLDSPPLLALPQTEVIKKQFTDNNYDGNTTTKKKKASFTNIKIIYNKFTNKCFLAKTWLKVTFSKKPKNDDTRAKWKSVDNVPATRLSEYEINRISHSLETFTDYAANISLVKETTPIEPDLMGHNIKTPDVKAPDIIEYSIKTPDIMVPGLMSHSIKISDIKIPDIKTPIYSSQATSEIDLSKPVIFEQPTTMSSQVMDIMQLCDQVFYGN